jgi:hypothetical protein
MTSAFSIHSWSPGNLLDEPLPGFPSIQHTSSAPAILQLASPARHPMSLPAPRAPLLSLLAQLVAPDDAPPVHAAMHAQLSAMKTPLPAPRAGCSLPS